MTVQREIITRLETRRSEVSLALGDLETARTSAAIAVRLAPKTHVEARTEALLALASICLEEGLTEEAGGIIAEANALVAPTEYRDLRERAERMAEGLAARSQAR
jgi:hypothetical protein